MPRQSNMIRHAAIVALMQGAILPAAASQLVDNGRLTDEAISEGNWTSSAGELTGKGMDSVIESKTAVGAGDFTVSATLHVQSGSPARAALVIDESADIGLAVPNGSKIYVRGFLFGDMTQQLQPLSDFAAPGDDVTITCARKADLLTCAIDGKTIWQMTYEADRPLGKIQVRAGSTTIGVKSFSYEGQSASLNGWMPPHGRAFPLMPDSVDVFKRGTDGYDTYRIPAMVRDNDGTLIAVCEGRKKSASDGGDIDLVVKRSTDSGRTWSPQILAYEDGGDAPTTIGNPAPVVDQRTGIVWLMFCRNTKRVFIGSSKDGGATWSPRREITSQVSSPAWSGAIHSGPGHGFQATDGTLVFPGYHGGPTSSFVMTTTDGIAFQYGADMGMSSGEPTAVQLSNGDLMMNARARPREWQRICGISADLGKTWKSTTQRADLEEPTCQGAMLAGFVGDNKKVVLFANPQSQRRERIGVRLSEDDGATWTDNLRIYGGSSAYSDLVHLDGDKCGILFERNGYEEITFSPFSLDDFHSRAAAKGKAPHES